MINLKQLLSVNQQIWIKVDNKKETQVKFLEWAKQNGCRWNNKEIDSQNDKCGFFMGIDKNLILGYVGLICWKNSKNAPKKIDFYEILGEK